MAHQAPLNPDPFNVVDFSAMLSDGLKEMDEYEIVHDPLSLIGEWNSAFGLKPFIEEDDYGRRKNTVLRARLISEEFREVSDELLDAAGGTGDRAKLAKELADLLYVVYGAAAFFEIPIYEVFAEVHASNMSKLGEDGKPILRPDGKILKGPNYREADIEAVLRRGEVD